MSATTAADTGIDAARLASACRSAASALERAPTPGEGIEGALGLLHAELGAAYVAAFLCEHDRLWALSYRGYTLIPDGLAEGDGVLGRALSTGLPQLILDVRRDPDYVALAKDVVSELAIPLQVGDATVGMLNLETTLALPPTAAEVVAPLAAALAPKLDAVRTARAVDLSALARVFVHVSSLRDVPAIAEIAVASLCRLFPLDTGQVSLHREDRSIEAIAEWSRPDAADGPLSAEAVRAIRGRVEPTVVFEFFAGGDLRDVGPAGELGGRAIAWLPLRANGEDIGVLVGTSRRMGVYDRGRAEVAAVLAAHAAASLDAALALGRERRSALTDPLTGLLNRRGFEEWLEQELARAQEDRLQLSVALLDCDDFKLVNDRAGHEFGDALLRELGQVLDGLVPEGSSAARLGGDEFVVMLPATEADLAERIANELRRRLAAGLADAGFPLHVSAGLTTYPYDGATGSQLLRGADQALYAAKEGGKNRVVAFRQIGRVGPIADVSVQATLQRERRRSSSGAQATALGEITGAAESIWAETSVVDVMTRLCKSLVFVVGATGCLASRVEGEHLVDVARHSLRDVSLGDEAAYLIADFPVTAHVLEVGETCALSFLDRELDPAEAFVLRELKMSCVLLVPVLAFDRAWGLVELYDVRLRRFSSADAEITEFLVGQAARRIETLADGDRACGRILPVFRLPE